MPVVRRRRRVGRRKLRFKELGRALNFVLIGDSAIGRAETTPPVRRRRRKARGKRRREKLGRPLGSILAGALAGDGASRVRRTRGRRRTDRSKLQSKKREQPQGQISAGDSAVEGANSAPLVRRRPLRARHRTRRGLTWKKLGQHLVLVLVCALALEGANIALQSFEGLVSDNWIFTSTPDPYNTEGDPIVQGGNENVWAPIQEFTGDIDAAADGSIFWGGQDLDNPIASGDHTLDFDDVDVSDFSAVQVSFQYNFLRLDSSDVLQYRTVFDGVVQPWTQLTSTGNNQTSNGWQTVTVSVPSLVSFFGLQVQANQDGPSEFIGLDDFRVEGTPDPGEVPEGSTILLVGLGLGCLGFARRRRST